MPAPRHASATLVAAPTLTASSVPAIRTARSGTGGLVRSFVVALVAFLTLVDLFATQAILPSLATAYGVSPAAMGFAVNASTIGMAVAGVAVALLGRRLPRRLGVSASLIVLAVPTALLATMPDLTTFAVLRVAQGLCMSAAFTLTMAYLAESSSAEEIGSALAAYVTGNVASNLFGRLMSAGIADHLGLSANFGCFAALNLIGAVLAWIGLNRCTRMAATDSGMRSTVQVWREHFRNPPLRAGFALGFLILFVFIGTFTYVNFMLVRPPLALGMMQLGFVYLVFVPSILTTPLAGRTVARFGVPRTFWAALAVAGIGLPLLLLPSLGPVLAGLALVAVGTFFAQATATGFVSRAATADRGSASGIYLASYYLGGLAGSAVLGHVFTRWGWSACVGAIGAALAVAALLVVRTRMIAEGAPARESAVPA